MVSKCVIKQQLSRSVYIYIYLYIYIHVQYIIETQTAPRDAEHALRRDLGTNLATEPCDILATHVAMETFRRVVCLGQPNHVPNGSTMYQGYVS